MQSGYNTVLVHIEKEFNDSIAAPEGMEFYQDTTYRPEHHTTIHGTVVSVPDFKCSGSWDLQVGDKIYFNYMTVLQPENKLPNNIYIVESALCIARVRAGELKPLGNHILLRPIIEVTEKIGDLFVPVVSQKKKLNKGIVVASNMDDIRVGETIGFSKVGKFENFIEGETLYCAFERNVWYKENKKRGKTKV